MRFASLGSGSRGNALLLEAGKTRILVDAGFGPREMARRLVRLGLLPEDITAVLVTHEHSDHVGGAFSCVRRFGWRLMLTHGSLTACGKDVEGTISTIDSHTSFSVGEIVVQPFPVPHDAREPVQFVFSDGDHRLGVLTDAGHVTAHMVAMLDGCDALVLECNHDSGMLAQGRYPASLKKRIAGGWGHLANDQSAGLLARIDRSRLRHLVAAHLSEENNRPQLARAALAGVMGCEEDWIGIATQEDGFAWREI